MMMITLQQIQNLSADPSSSVDRTDEDAVQPPRLTLGLFDIVSTVRMLSNLGVAKTKVNPASRTAPWMAGNCIPSFCSVCGLDDNVFCLCRYIDWSWTVSWIYHIRFLQLWFL